ncbi:MAG: peptidylprolyl isomerase [Verrucomicrobiota bacterium]
MTLGRSLISRLVFLFSVACLPALPAQTPDDGLDLRFANGIAAVVEDRVITVDDIRRELAPILPQIRSGSRNAKEFQDNLEQAQNDIVRRLVDRVLIVKDFYKDERRSIPASYIDNAIAEQMTTQFGGDRSKFLAYLRARGFTLRDYRKEVEEDLVYGYQRNQQRRSQSVVSPAKVEAYYAANKQKFFEEEQSRLRLIQLLRQDGETDAELTARANDILAKFKAGTSFEELAKEHTDDASKTRGGDWGWQKRTDLKAEFSDPLFALKPGEVSAPIVQSEGVYLLYCEEHKDAGVPPIDEVRAQIELVLSEQMTRESIDKWLERLRRDAYVRLY